VINWKFSVYDHYNCIQTQHVLKKAHHSKTTMLVEGKICRAGKQLSQWDN